MANANRPASRATSQVSVLPPTTNSTRAVMPFILRGISLLGIYMEVEHGVACSDCGSDSAADLRPRHLDRIVTREIIAQ